VVVKIKEKDGSVVELTGEKLIDLYLYGKYFHEDAQRRGELEQLEAYMPSGVLEFNFRVMLLGQITSCVCELQEMVKKALGC
jgi:hypothetical protein